MEEQNMIKPELAELLKRADCRYTLVVETSKRARQIVSGAEPLVEAVGANAVITAVQEIYEDKITYVKPEE